MLADSQTYPICTQNFIQIGPAVLEEFGFKHRDTRILYIRLWQLTFLISQPDNSLSSEGAEHVPKLC